MCSCGCEFFDLRNSLESGRMQDVHVLRCNQEIELIVQFEHAVCDHFQSVVCYRQEPAFECALELGCLSDGCQFSSLVVPEDGKIVDNQFRVVERARVYVPALFLMQHTYRR